MTAPQDLPDRTEHRGHTTRSRMGGVWVAMIVAAFVLLLLLIFILQNGQRAEVSFLGAHGSLPMGVALLLAAVFGVLLVALPGTARIVQLRLAARRRAGVAVPAANQPTDQPTADQPTAGPTTGQPTAGQPTAGQPTAGQPTAGQPTAGPTADQPITDRSDAAL